MNQNPSILQNDETLLTLRPVRELTNRRRVLSASLLSSTGTQDALRRLPSSSVDPEASAVISQSEAHAQSNSHRVAFSVTSFPFRDPSPHSESPNLLGIRIDICGRDGKFAKPYYLLLKRVGSDKKALRVHRHTIPAFIPLEKLQERHLPEPPELDDDNASTKAWKQRKQDLRKLVRELRRELVAWHIRKDAIAWLREQLGISEGSGDNESISNRRIVLLEATSIEANFVRVKWADGRTGRFRISNQGFVEQITVLDDNGRDKRTESLLAKGDGRVESLVHRLFDTQKPNIEV